MEEKTEEELKSIQSIEEPKMDISHPDFLRPYRLVGETDKQYKIRRLFNKMYQRQRKQGNIMWIAKDSKMPIYEEPGNKNSKIIGHTVSKGFTYNKKQVEEAMTKYNKEKQEQSNTNNNG